MPLERNKGRGPKVITYRLASEEGDDELYALTFRMARGLLSTVEYFQWLSRHIQLPDDLSDQKLLNDWVDNLRERLMSPFDPLAEICSRIINCIQTDDDVKDAFRDFITGDSVINNHFDNKYLGGGGTPFPEIEGLTSTINLDELWAQCAQIVEYTDEQIVQLLAVLEVQTNNLELAEKSLNTIPFFGYLMEAVPVNDWLDAADYFFDIVGEQYDSGFDTTVPTGSKWILTCTIFKKCKVDGVITVERIWNAIADLLAPYTVISWDNASELLETLIGTNDNSTVVAYATFGLVWGVAKLSSILGLDVITTKVLEVILEIAKNDANDDHLTLCPECAEYPDPVFRVIDVGGFPGGSYGVTNNCDGTYIVLFNSVIGSDGTYRCTMTDDELKCWEILTVFYSDTPNGANFVYECGANPINDTDPFNGVVDDTLRIGECYGGIFASKTTGHFTVQITIRECEL